MAMNWRGRHLRLPETGQVAQVHAFGPTQGQAGVAGARRGGLA